MLRNLLGRGSQVSFLLPEISLILVKFSIVAKFAVNLSSDSENSKFVSLHALRISLALSNIST